MKYPMVYIICPFYSFLQILGYMDFNRLAHHVIIGNQVIVRGQNRALVRSTIDSLKVSATCILFVAFDLIN